MKPSVFKVPTRDARDADHLAIILVVTGIYWWLHRSRFSDAMLPWIFGITVTAILSGVLLWLRVPFVKWLGVLVWVAICVLGIHRLMLNGFSLITLLGAMLPIFFAIWTARIDYLHKFVDDDGD